jgi:ribonucleoside-diphosphate reductase alpha chain
MTRAVGTPSGAGDAGSKGRGKAAQGLRIERVWTTEGVHPYDEVTWERRDVVMTNWRDGSVNFEQRGVEFPDFWSINAANIVTTKYFRGALGTPQREVSLRQIIDRVVGRIASPIDMSVCRRAESAASAPPAPHGHENDRGTVSAARDNQL